MLRITGSFYTPNFYGKTEKPSSRTARTPKPQPTRTSNIRLNPAFNPNIKLDTLEKVELDNQDSIAILEKVKKYMKILPDGAKMTKPVFIITSKVPVGNKLVDNDVSFVLDKSEPYKTKLTIKTGARDLVDWSLTDGYSGETLSCIFDNTGRMIQGDMIFTDSVTKVKRTYGRALHFERSDKNRRTIEVDGVVYQSEKGRLDNWQRVASSVPKEMYPSEPREVSFYFSHSASALMEIFKQLSRKDTSVLA